MPGRGYTASTWQSQDWSPGRSDLSLSTESPTESQTPGPLGPRIENV